MESLNRLTPEAAEIRNELVAPAHEVTIRQSLEKAIRDGSPYADSLRALLKRAESDRRQTTNS